MQSKNLLFLCLGILIGTCGMGLFQSRFFISFENKGNTMFKLDRWTGHIDKCVNSSQGIYYSREELENSVHQYHQSFKDSTDRFFNTWADKDTLLNIKQGGKIADQSIEKLMADTELQKESLTKQLEEVKSGIDKYFRELQSNSMVCKAVVTNSDHS